MTDGTTEGTVLVEDFAEGEDSSIPCAMTPAGTGMYYFVSGADLVEHGLRSFDQWIESFPLAGKAGEPLANPSGDGIPNLIKYAFNLDPAGPDVRPMDAITATGLPVLDASGAEPRFEYLEHHGAPLTYEPQYAEVLDDWRALEGGVERRHLNASGIWLASDRLSLRRNSSSESRCRFVRLHRKLS